MVANVAAWRAVDNIYRHFAYPYDMSRRVGQFVRAVRLRFLRKGRSDGCAGRSASDACVFMILAYAMFWNGMK